MTGWEASGAPERSRLRRPAYHHGDLRNALLRESVALAREGGPRAIVLREAARRAGVSPNAAYAHFSSLPDLVGSVAEQALSGLALAMEHEQSVRRRRGDPGDDAVESLTALGRGYVVYALAEPGLFRTAFDTGVPVATYVGAGASGLTPLALIEEALDRMVHAKRLRPLRRRHAVNVAWSAVHGLSVLLLGPLAGLPDGDRETLLRSTLEMVVMRMELNPG